MKYYKYLVLNLFCLIFFFGIGCQSEKKQKNNQPMIRKNISFSSTDDIISSLKEIYQNKGLEGVKEWVNDTFQTNSQITVARDITNISKVDTSIVYDRTIVKLTKAGEETEVYYLAPIHDDAFSSNLFLSIRLNFIDEPFEFLIYTKGN